MPFGSEVALSPGLSLLERGYISIFGVPILGLRIRARTILPFLRNVGQPERIVDVGSGRGVMTLACARFFKDSQVIGVDLNDEQNKINNSIARQLDIKNLEFKTFDAMNLPDLGEFDLIISTDMLEHLDDDLGGVRMFYNSLHKGGRLLVHVPHLTRNTFGWKRENWLDVDGHVRPGYSRQGLIDLLTSGGFLVEKCIYNYNSFETLANDLSKAITGAKEKNKMLYALCFPFLQIISMVGALYAPKDDGSGLVAVAVKE